VKPDVGELTTLTVKPNELSTRLEYLISAAVYNITVSAVTSVGYGTRATTAGLTLNASSNHNYSYISAHCPLPPPHQNSS